MEKKTRILIVEDELLYGYELKLILENGGYEVAGLAQGIEEALQLIRTEKIDFALIDVNLQQPFEGIEIASFLRVNLNIPFIFLTGHYDEATIERAKKAQPFNYMIKPVKEIELLTNIKMALFKSSFDLKLQEREKWFSTIINNIGEGIISTDTIGSINFMNPMAENLLNCEMKNVLDTNFETIAKIFNYTSGDQIENLIEKLSSENSLESKNMQALLVRSDGKNIPVTMTCSIIRDERGINKGFVFVVRDMTEEYENFKNLVQAENKYRTLIESSPIGIIIMDIKNFRVSYANPEFYKIFFIKTCSLNEISVEEIFQDKVLFRDIVSDSSKHEYNNLKIKIKNGKEIYIDLWVNPSKIKNIPHIILFFKDITEIKKSEEELKTYRDHLEILIAEKKAELMKTQEQLIRSNQLAAVGELAAGINHELNQPLQAMSLMVYTINKHLGKKKCLDDETVESLKTVRHCVDRMSRILNHMRFFTRDIKSIFSEMNINESVENSLIFITQQLKVKNIELKLELQKDLPLIMGDLRQLEHVSLNMLTNARDAVGSGGIITVRSFLREEKIFIEWENNGKMIPEKIIKSIFNPFFTTKDPDKGTGLGLSIAYGIVQEHKGDLNVMSTKEKTVFTMWLPLRLEE